MTYKLQELLNINQIQSLLDRLSEIYSFTTAILDNEGNILTATAWQDICLKFHRRNEESRKECIKSDRYIFEHINSSNPAVNYRCRHGLMDSAMPIIINGVHYGNFFTGQFFVEKPDLNFFREQARKYNFDEEEYLSAVRKVPILTVEQLNRYLLFMKSLLEVISNMGLKQLQTIESGKKIQESEVLLQSIIENLPNAVFLKDAINLNYIRFNKAAEQMMGWKREDLIDKNAYDIFPKEQADLFAIQDRQVLESGLLADIPEEPVDTINGRRIIHTKKIPIMDEYGKPKYLLGISEDITQQKKAEEDSEKLQQQLNQAQKMESVGQLAGGVAHDFNNMLTAILGHTEMAMIRCLPSNPIYNDLKAIEQAARRSADLTRQLLAFARKQTVSPRTLDLNNTVAGMLKMLKRLIGEDIEFVWHPGENIWLIKIDPSQIDQILANLCVNARDAIAGIGKIILETKNASFDEAYCSLYPGYLPGDYVMLAVNDNGRGIDKNIIDRIFEPFFTTKEAGKGSGLGLATVYGIVKQNKGFINVYSEPGEGSTFKIYLPRVLNGILEPINATVTDIQKGHGEIILLVEDEMLILDVNRSMLEELGFRVLTARTPGEAFLHARAHVDEIRLLITDVIMPEMNGLDLAKRLIEIIPSLRCLFTSGYTANVIAHHGVLNEDVMFLQKPFSKHDLAVKVREVMEQK